MADFRKGFLMSHAELSPLSIHRHIFYLTCHLCLYCQAKQTYDDAVDSGYTAMLMEEDDASGDIFRCLVGNLPPGAEAAIKFAYVIELRLSPEGAVMFVLPTQLNPRYNPSEAGLHVCSWLSSGTAIVTA